MGPEVTMTATRDFTGKVPPYLDGRVNYESYRDDVLLWMNLTDLGTTKHGPSLIGRLCGEDKASEKSLSIKKIWTEEGMEKVLKRPDRQYAVDAVNQLDTDLTNFLEYT